LKEKGLQYIGTGVSGGEEGARYGPSIMPGGSPAAWFVCLTFLKSVLFLSNFLKKKTGRLSKTSFNLSQLKSARTHAVIG
jgi:6-phosphogluconate dehydrogenase (decarboxylating)